MKITTLALTSFVLATVFTFGFSDKAPPIKAEEPKDTLVKKDIPAYLQNISVTIHTEQSQGSGVIKVRDGVSYILTAGHVIDDLRKTRTIVDPKTGSSRVKIEFDDAKVVKEIYEDGRSVGVISMDAEVLRYSDFKTGEDLALLRVRKKDFIKESVVFDKRGIMPVGTELFHVGSLLGQTGSNSLTTGVVSQTGRVVNGNVYDQSTCAAFPGSSGGGIYNKTDGAYIGMLVRGAGETFNLYVPMRRIKEWSDRVGIAFIFDDTISVPTEKELKKIPIEEVAGEVPSVEKAVAKPNKFSFLIERN